MSRREFVLPLLKAGGPDSQGHVFTRECLERCVADFQSPSGAALPVYGGFTTDLRLALGQIGSVTDLFMQGDELMAKILMFDTDVANAATALVDEKVLELAAGGQVEQIEGDEFGKPLGPRTVDAIKLTDVALVKDKVK